MTKDNVYTVLKREKNEILILETIYSNTPILYSYTQIPIPTEKMIPILEWLQQYGIKNVYMLWGKNEKIIISKKENPEIYDKFLNRFFELIKLNSVMREAVPNLIFDTDIPGTSKIIRSKDKTIIYIARRKDNKTRINSTCINDTQREKFFEDSKQCHGIPDKNSKYKLDMDDGAIFEKWATFMDNEYFRLDAKNKLQK